MTASLYKKCQDINSKNRRFGTDRQTDRQTDKQRQRQRETETDRFTHIQFTHVL